MTLPYVMKSPEPIRTAADFRAALDRLGLTQSSLARLLQVLGHPAEIAVSRRRIQRWVAGDAPIAGEMIALIALLDMVPGTARRLAALPELNPRPGRPPAE
jgi:transcriptional regulator with XRE-family HTH domain